MKGGWILVSMLWVTGVGISQDVPLEYHVKAGFLYNFTKFVEWPEDAFGEEASFSLCMAELNPFGSVLQETIAGEAVAGRPVVVRVANGSPAGCHVLFVPHAVSPAPYLRQVRALPVLTIGESPVFIQQGGIVNFVQEANKIRFEINAAAAARSKLMISSRVLKLARLIEPGP